MAFEGKVYGDRYEVLARLGQGGAATVHRVRDRVLEIECALKVLDLRARRSQEVQRARFAREARALARLRHENILSVFDVNLEEVPYLVCELCPAGGLDKRLERGAVPADEAISLALQVADALGFAHGSGVIHRDVKPANILIGPDGKAKLCDFGIAKVDDETRYTADCVVMGSMAYMPPEQRIDTASVTAKADQYSLAATLHAMVTGETPVDLFAAKPNSPRWWAVPKALAPVLQRAVSHQEQDRYPDIGAFARALRQAREQLSVPDDREKPETEPLAGALPEAVNWYRTTMADRIDQVRSALVALGARRPNAHAELRRLGHMLRGSGRSFGFPAVSTAAGALEDASDRDIPNRASELIYVLRHIESPEKAVAGAIILCDDARFADTLKLMLPDAQSVRPGEIDATALSNAAVLIAKDVEASVISTLRLANPRLPIVVLGDEDSKVWLAAGADRVLPAQHDPIKLLATVRGLHQRRSSALEILSIDGFASELAERRNRDGVDFHEIFMLDAGGVPNGLLDIRSLAGWPVLLGCTESELFVSVPSTHSERLLEAIPDDVRSRSRIVSTPVTGQTVSEMLATLFEVVAQCELGTYRSFRPTGAARQVVVVEDDPAVGRLLRDVISAQGHDVQIYANGARALVGIAKQVPDLILLDVDLPGMDGMAVLQALKMDPKTARTPVLMLTARQTQADVLLSLELGATDHVAKPFDVRILAARIRNLLSR